MTLLTLPVCPQVRVPDLTNQLSTRKAGAAARPPFLTITVKVAAVPGGPLRGETVMEPIDRSGRGRSMKYDAARSLFDSPASGTLHCESTNAIALYVPVREPNVNG